MVILTVLVAALATVGAVVAALAVAAAAARRQRDATVRAAVDTVLAVAGERLDAHAGAGTRELDVRSQAIARQLSDMRGELGRVTELVGVLQRERAEQHGQLVRGLEQASQATGRLAETAQHLREALASPKARGQWGERMADDVLRTAGFVEGINYRKQRAVAGGTVPDFTFLLPDGLVVHMDVKFPVDNYLRFLEAASDTDRDACRTAFLRDVRNRVKELTGRGYCDSATTVGYVLLFIPNESVYGFIHEHDAQLADAALAQRVVLCSPFTLFAVLGVVRQAVDCFQLQRSSDEILDVLGRFATQWDKFTQQVDTLGTRLGSAQRAYDELVGTRRRQLERHLDEIETIRTRRDTEGGGELRALPA
jgi:DNA recombination protein RmuC